MKPVFLLLVVLFGAMGFNTLYAQTYVPFPEVAYWNYERSVAVEGIEYTSIVMEGDTLIQGNVYRKVYGYSYEIYCQCCNWLGEWDCDRHTCLNKAYLGALREDGNKNIWFRSNLITYYNNNDFTCHLSPCPITNNNTTEILLYKFDLAIGDTLPIYNRLTTQPYIVEAIDSVNSVADGWQNNPILFDTYRKRYKIRNVRNSNNPSIDYWVEGVGSQIHLFEPILSGSVVPLAQADSCQYYWETATSYQLICYSTTAQNCPILTSAPTLSTINGLLVKPNPFNQQLSLIYSGDLQTNVLLSVTNLQGSIVAQQKFSSTNHFTHTFDLQHLPAGIYFVSLQTNKGVWVQKVVKSNE
jgi:hypothetical protein